MCARADPSDHNRWQNAGRIECFKSQCVGKKPKGRLLKLYSSTDAWKARNGGCVGAGGARPAPKAKAKAKAAAGGAGGAGGAQAKAAGAGGAQQPKLKTENERLKAEIERLKAGGAADVEEELDEQDAAKQQQKDLAAAVKVAEKDVEEFDNYFGTDFDPANA